MINMFAQAPDFSFLDWLGQGNDPTAARNLFGVIPAYPVFMFTGILLVIIASIIQFKLRKMPLKELELGIMIVVPLGVIGASIFGKVFIPYYQQGNNWYKVFFFWEPGMSLFGSLALGIAAGFVWFYKRSKITLISVWVYADCIIPNILLGQMMGRWGNFFNHELMGAANLTYEDLSWLPNAIRDKMFLFPDLSGFSYVMDHPTDWFNLEALASHMGDISELDGRTLSEVIESPLMYHSPLFLFESIGNLLLWLLITFGVANIGRVFSKPKPWDLEPKAYPGWYNKQHKSLSEGEIIWKDTLAPIKYKQVRITTDNGEIIELKLSFFRAWNKAYYWYEPNSLEVLKFEKEYEERSARNYQGEQRLKTLKPSLEKAIKKIEKEYSNKLSRVAKNSNKYKELVAMKKQDISTQKDLMNTRKDEIYSTIGKWSRRFNINPDAREIEKLHNPNGHLIIRTGVTTGAYIFGYMLLRIILETMRRPQDLFMQNLPIPNFIVLALLLITGLVIIGVTQFVSPYKWRELGWLYEKSY
ncbi:prolipoprotein diacylglyceryl transferase [[Acholeplasma] multilocale]|uniref:prolipoprotein diacylglyceryl transferase n=1 Tax=[Acholeplasma] multilocale TaxID=264638 RepID=UPI000478A0B5|nr:prolipoprotein diacylglyceryl transferase family protein [[Acholeplasma] multilocale]